MISLKKNYLLFQILIFAQLCNSQNTIQTRFAVPYGFFRTKEAVNSFGYYLRDLPLKPTGSQVKYFNGSIKLNQNIYDAVIDLPIGNKNLHQCADAVMRLRADYFYKINNMITFISSLQMVLMLNIQNGDKVIELLLKATKPRG